MFVVILKPTKKIKYVLKKITLRWEISIQLGVKRINLVHFSFFGFKINIIGKTNNK